MKYSLILLTHNSTIKHSSTFEMEETYENKIELKNKSPNESYFANNVFLSTYSRRQTTGCYTLKFRGT